MQSVLKFMSPYLVLLAAVIGVGVFVVKPWKESIPDGIEFVSTGGRWVASDPKWAEYRGAWRAETVFYPKRVRNVSLDGPKLIKSLCGAFLSNMHRQTGVKAKRSKVYRLSMNVRVPQKSGFESIWPSHVPVAVKDGACQVKPESELYSPRFPNELMPWEMAKVNVTDGGKTGVFSFFPVDKEGADGLEFPFELACDALLKDQSVWARLGAMEPVVSLEDEMTHIWIQHSTFNVGSGRLFQITTFKGFRFSRVGNTCTNGVSIDA